MKLQDFLVGIGLFALFTVIIFGAINTSDPNGIYSEEYLNVTHDSETLKSIVNISNTGSSVNENFNTLSGDAQNFTGGENPSESSLVGSSLKVLINIPKSFVPVASALRETERQMGVPLVFKQWLVGSVVLIIILIIIAAFVKNPLKS